MSEVRTTSRKTRVGKVVSNKMDKTIVVAIEDRVQHPLYKVLHDQPNPEMTSYTFREVLMTHRRIYGNAYAQIIRNGRGDVLGLYPLAANRVRVEREDSGELVILKVVTVDGEEFLETIEDEDEMDEIAVIFMERLEEDYDVSDEE